MREFAVALPRTIAALPSWISSRSLRPSLSPQLRRRLILAALIAFLVGALYHFWLRDSPLVAVNDVQVTGLTTKDGPVSRRSSSPLRRT